MSKVKKIKELESLIYNLELELKKSKVILNDLSDQAGDTTDYNTKVAQLGKEIKNEDGIIIEGVFNGQIMIGPDGKEYSVPANYASKSKLVEGDILKLTIDPEGTFIYKQIAPVERARLVGHLVRDKESSEFIVLASDKMYKVLLASVTYFKGMEGDEIVILVPKDKDSSWAAVENIIKNKNHLSQLEDEIDLNL